MLALHRTLRHRRDSVFFLHRVLYHARSGVFGYKPKREDVVSKTTADSHVANQVQNANILRLVNAYRIYGHKKATLDPLGLKPIGVVPELSIDRYGLSSSHVLSNTDGIISGTDEEKITIADLVTQLENTYCKNVAAEFTYLQTEEERNWFAAAMETKDDKTLTNERKVDLAKLLLKCQTMDQYFGTKFATVKRYGGEGGESMMGVFDEIFLKSCQAGVTNIVICMPHRGRLNFLTCMLDFPPYIIFKKMQGKTEHPSDDYGTGDIPTHFYLSKDLTYGDAKVHVSIIPNPSHLEANNPVAVGKVRAKQLYLGEGDYSNHDDARPGDQVLCLQVHGDASFTAQGVVSETFCIAGCPHYRVGGSVHLIVNNQIGFTTESILGRSSLYASDSAKVNNYPVLHVNADYPEEVVRATSIAMDYRQKFRKDVIIDLICFRKWGHNELDDPSFTQPVMYQTINSRTSIPDLYAKQIIEDGICKSDDLSSVVEEWNAKLSSELGNAASSSIPAKHLKEQWSDIIPASDSVTKWDTGVETNILKFVGARSVQVPDTLKVHPTIQKTHIDRRQQRMIDGASVDWSGAEALAVGSLLYQGYNVRISGQDVGRATFSHRHVMIVDQETDDIYIPLNNIVEEQTGHLEVANSALSEEAVLGFEYGFSIENPNTLPIWEAQFGDFFNGAQTIIDTYITCGEDKWLLQSGLVMLLPHGMDGAGPDHSSCRIERFLQMTNSKEDGVDGDSVNFQIVNPTTPAQYFHLLRRQMLRNFRKPLVIVAPKVLLRLPTAMSSLSDMAPGSHFQPVLCDPGTQASNCVTKVVFVSGKHYYNLAKEREAKRASDMAIIRLESLCPFPADELRKEVAKYPNAKDFIWSQEEHRNMGAWSFVAPRFQNILGVQLRYVGRGALGVPATGIPDVHKMEAAQVLEQTFL